MPGGRRGSSTRSRRLSRASARWCAPPSPGGVVSFALLPLHGQRHPGHLRNTRFKMLTQIFLEFPGGGFRAQAAVLLEGQHEAPAECVENEAIGYRMHEPARDGADARERFQAVAGDREAERQRAPDAALAQGEEFLDVEVARCRAVELAERPRHRGPDVALYHDVGSRADRGERADHRLARRAADDLLGPLLAVALLRFVELLRREREHGAVAALVELGD